MTTNTRHLPTHCAICNEPISEMRQRYQYVTCVKRPCRRAWQQSRSKFYRGFPETTLAPSWQGGASELRVAVDLIERGYEVFRQMIPYASCDLIILHGECCYRVECRTGYYRGDGTVRASSLKNFWGALYARIARTFKVNSC